MTDHKWPDDALVASKRIVESMGRSDFTFLDVGAHHGESVQSLKDWNLVSARCFAFEPNRNNFKTLKSRVGGISDDAFSCELLEYGVGATSRVETFTETRASAVGGMLVPVDGLDARVPSGDHQIVDEYEVKLVAIDDFIESRSVERIDFLKIDTEGYDLEVLKGASSALTKGLIKVILTEAFFVNYRQGQCFYWDIAKYLHDFGFSFVNFFDTRNTSQDRIYTGNALWVSSETADKLGYL